MTDYPRCKTCKHYDDGVGFHRMCNAPLVFYGYGPISAEIKSGITPEIKSAIEQFGLKVEDDEGWGMIPGPEFGCVLHEEK